MRFRRFIIVLGVLASPWGSLQAPKPQYGKNAMNGGGHIACSLKVLEDR